MKHQTVRVEAGEAPYDVIVGAGVLREVGGLFRPLSRARRSHL